MLDIIKEILTSPAGSFGSMLAIALGIIFLFYKAGRLVEKFGIVKKMEGAIEKIKEDIAEIKVFMNMMKEKYNPFAKAKSPISLSEMGETVSKDLKIKSMIAKKWDSINSKIKKALKEDDNPYNIQQICFEIGKKYSEIASKEELDYIKTYAYKHGYNLYDFDLIFGIEIRNKYFDQEGITVTDVDVHDPNSSAQKN